MTKNKLTFLIGFIIVLGVLLYNAYSNEPQARTSIPLQNSDETVAKAKQVFTEYLEATNARDLQKIESLSYKLTSTCKDEKETEKCHTLIDTAHYFGNDIRLEKLTNVWGDSNQLILSSPFAMASSSDVGTSTAAWIRSIIYFTLEHGDNPKILYFSPAEGVATHRTATSSEAAILTRLKALSQDTDQDGLPDISETCADSPDKSKCVKTDSSKRDTDGNGYWDGTDRLINSRS